MISIRHAATSLLSTMVANTLHAWKVTTNVLLQLKFITLFFILLLSILFTNCACSFEKIHTWMWHQWCYTIEPNFEIMGYLKFKTLISCYCSNFSAVWRGSDGHLSWWDYQTTQRDWIEQKLQCHIAWNQKATRSGPATSGNLGICFIIFGIPIQL